jgi:hypothetical protein
MVESARLGLLCCPPPDVLVVPRASWAGPLELSACAEPYPVDVTRAVRGAIQKAREDESAADRSRGGRAVRDITARTWRL